MKPKDQYSNRAIKIARISKIQENINQALEGFNAMQGAIKNNELYEVISGLQEAMEKTFGMISSVANHYDDGSDDRSNYHLVIAETSYLKALCDEATYNVKNYMELSVYGDLVGVVPEGICQECKRLFKPFLKELAKKYAVDKLTDTDEYDSKEFSYLTFRNYNVKHLKFLLTDGELAKMEKEAKIEHKIKQIQDKKEKKA